MNTRSILFSIIATILLAACSGGTKITDSWSNTALTPVKFKKMAVVGVTSRVDGRKAVELAMEEKLIASGILAIGAFDFLPPNASKNNITQEIFYRYLDLEKFDAVMIISVLAREKKVTSTMSVSTYASYAPMYGMPLNDYYGTMAGYASVPVSQTTTPVIYLECALYSYPQGEMIWGATSKTTPLVNIEATTQEYAMKVVQDLKKRKVLEGLK